MLALERDRYFTCEPETYVAAFEREPFALSHRLDRLDLFGLSNLERLAQHFKREDYFVAAGAKTAATEFYSVAHDILHPCEAIRALDAGGQRILLKRLENYDPDFRELLQSLVAEIFGKRGASEHLARLQSSVLISSSATITPFHFDPEVSFFFQIEGPKRYHLYSPSAVSEQELEEFYKRGIVDIAQLDLAGRDAQHEHVFDLVAGTGMHQPRNSPHWVETGASRSISYVVSYETTSMRVLDRIRAFNYYLRRAGMAPQAIGTNPPLDSLKAKAMQISRPVRQGVRKAVHRLRRS